MTVLVNTFEGGSNGTTITTGNSGGASGNAFDIVNIGASATVAYSVTEAAHGSLSAKLVTPVSAVNAFVAWTASLTGSTVPQVWLRAYVWLPALPAGTLRVLGTRNGTTVCGGIGINSSGNVVTLNAPGLVQTTSTAVVPTSAWFRLEGYIIGSASAGQIQVQIFTAGEDATTPVETNTTGSAINTNAAINHADFGNPASIASYTFYIDDIGASTTGYLGPVSTSRSADSSIVPIFAAAQGL